MSVMLSCEDHYTALKQYIGETGERRIFLVCGHSSENLPIGRFFRELEGEGFSVTRFSGFSPNPDLSSVEAGIRSFRESNAGLLVALGGGSAIDVAKCIRLFLHADLSVDILSQGVNPSRPPFLIIPTTAGSGSEATRFAVVYREGNKLSITEEGALPDAVCLDPGVLETLPLYQKKATMLDALCHAIESYWSVGSTGESREDSAAAIRLILSCHRPYLAGDPEAREPLMRASNLAGRAINIARTTAGHAMCYKLTTTYGLAHGHAAALCVDVLWPYMVSLAEDPVKTEQQADLKETLQCLSRIVADDPAADISTGPRIFHTLVYETLAMERPKIRIPEDLKALADTVNPERLKNHPVRLTEEVLMGLYRQIGEES